MNLVRAALAGVMGGSLDGSTHSGLSTISSRQAYDRCHLHHHRPRCCHHVHRHCYLHQPPPPHPQTLLRTGLGAIVYEFMRAPTMYEKPVG